MIQSTPKEVAERLVAIDDVCDEEIHCHVCGEAIHAKEKIWRVYAFGPSTDFTESKKNAIEYADGVRREIESMIEEQREIGARQAADSLGGQRAIARAGGGI